MHGKEKPRWAPARGQSKKKHPGWCFFFALAPCRRPTGLLLPLPFPGAAAKKQHPGWCFFFCSGPVERSRRPKERNKKKHSAHPGPTAKNFLETNDAGHEQKGATTKKKHPGRDIPILIALLLTLHTSQFKLKSLTTLLQPFLAMALWGPGVLLSVVVTVVLCSIS